MGRAIHLICPLVLALSLSHLSQVGADLLPDLINDCEQAFVPDDVCAILYDDDGCEGWELQVKQGYTPLTWWYRNDAEAVLVKRGCTLVAFDKSGKTTRDRGRQFVLDASGYRRHLYKDLRGSNELEDDIESVECQCTQDTGFNQGTRDSARRGEVTTALQSSNAGGECQAVRFNGGTSAILFDAQDCQLGSWDAPLYVQDGQYRTFSLFQSLFNWSYKNAVESFALKEGCTLEVYKDSDFSDGGKKFQAVGGNLYFTLAKDPKTASLSNDIESIRVYC